jgi:hypothetical protein
MNLTKGFPGTGEPLIFMGSKHFASLSRPVADVHKSTTTTFCALIHVYKCLYIVKVMLSDVFMHWMIIVFLMLGDAFMHWKSF